MASERQKKVLRALLPYWGDDWVCGVYTSTIAEEAGLTYREARHAVRALARQGLTVLVRGLFDEDFRVAGSGYFLTAAGYHAAKDLPSTPANDDTPEATLDSLAPGA